MIPGSIKSERIKIMKMPMIKVIKESLSKERVFIKKQKEGCLNDLVLTLE